MCGRYALYGPIAFSREGKAALDRMGVDLMKHAPEAALAYHPVAKAVGSPKNKGPELVEPVEA